MDESQYHTTEIQTALIRIEEDGITPDERAKMIEESYTQKAKQRGIDDGKQSKALEIAKNMLEKGFDIKTIAEITGLAEETINY